MGPLAPGTMCHGCSGSLGAVQPQAGSRLVMITTWLEMLVT